VPVANFGHVVATFRDVELVLDQPVAQHLLGVRGGVLKPRHAMDHVSGKVEAIDFVR
jgi:hypothetical protein